MKALICKDFPLLIRIRRVQYKLKSGGLYGYHCSNFYGPKFPWRNFGIHRFHLHRIPSKKDQHHQRTRKESHQFDHHVGRNTLHGILRIHERFQGRGIRQQYPDSCIRLCVLSHCNSPILSDILPSR